MAPGRPRHRKCVCHNKGKYTQCAKSCWEGQSSLKSIIRKIMTPKRFWHRKCVCHNKGKCTQCAKSCWEGQGTLKPVSEKYDPRKILTWVVRLAPKRENAFNVQNHVGRVKGAKNILSERVGTPWRLELGSAFVIKRKIAPNVQNHVGRVKEAKTNYPKE